MITIPRRRQLNRKKVLPKAVSAHWKAEKLILNLK